MPTEAVYLDHKVEKWCSQTQTQTLSSSEHTLITITPNTLPLAVTS